MLNLCLPIFAAFWPLRFFLLYLHKTRQINMCTLVYQSEPRNVTVSWPQLCVPATTPVETRSSFPPWELWSERLRVWLQADPSASSSGLWAEPPVPLDSGQKCQVNWTWALTLCQHKLTRPVKESHLDWELKCSIEQNSELRGIYP